MNKQERVLRRNGSHKLRPTEKLQTSLHGSPNFQMKRTKLAKQTNRAYPVKIECVFGERPPRHLNRGAKGTEELPLSACRVVLQQGVGMRIFPKAQLNQQ